MKVPFNRVDQLDSELLDNELFELLYTNLNACFQYQNLPRILNRIKTHNTDELRLLLKLVIFKFTIWNTSSSYGTGLQNLKITSNHIWKRHLLLSILVGDYLLKKFESYIYSYDQETRLTEWAKTATTNLANIFKSLSLINFLMFLVDGKYPTLAYRIFSLRLTKASPHSTSINDTENISYEFQNRQLVWNTLTEFLIFIIPMLKIPNYSNLWSSKKPETEQVLVANKPINKCAICIQQSRSTNIAVPYVTNCNHVYCYICIITKLETFNESNKNNSVKEHWTCLECGKGVIWCKPYENVDEAAIFIKTAEALLDDEIVKKSTDDNVARSDIIEAYKEEEENYTGIDSDELADEDEEESGFFVEE